MILRPLSQRFKNWPQRLTAYGQAIRIVPRRRMFVDAFNHTYGRQQPKSPSEDVGRYVLGRLKELRVRAGSMHNQVSDNE
jgi:hypothetical protein